jgi:hypothetical protein
LRKRKLIIGTTLALSLAAAGTAQADTGVQSLKGEWSGSNSTVQKTPDGVHFGTYANGGAVGGSLVYTGANDLKLSDVKDFSYTFTYLQDGITTGAAPYARIFLDSDGDHQADTDVILDPSLCATATPAQAKELTYQMVGGSVRYGDDGCGGFGAVEPGNQPWSNVLANHGNDRITKVAVTQGFSTGKDVSALLRKITFNGQTFAFDTGPLDGATGAAGTNGTNGTNGVTTIVHEYGRLTGARMRTIHVPKLKGSKFLGVRASLRGKRLRAHGRTVKVDLRGKAAGNYNVRLVARYKKGGKVHTVRSIRSLSITRS